MTDKHDKAIKEIPQARVRGVGESHVQFLL